MTEEHTYNIDPIASSFRKFVKVCTELNISQNLSEQHAWDRIQNYQSSEFPSLKEAKPTLLDSQSSFQQNTNILNSTVFKLDTDNLLGLEMYQINLNCYNRQKERCMQNIEVDECGSPKTSSIHFDIQHIQRECSTEEARKFASFRETTLTFLDSQFSAQQDTNMLNSAAKLGTEKLFGLKMYQMDQNCCNRQEEIDMQNIEVDKCGLSPKTSSFHFDIQRMQRECSTEEDIRDVDLNNGLHLRKEEISSEEFVSFQNKLSPLIDLPQQIIYGLVELFKLADSVWKIIYIPKNYLKRVQYQGEQSISDIKIMLDNSEVVFKNLMYKTRSLFLKSRQKSSYITIQDLKNYLKISFFVHKYLNFLINKISKLETLKILPFKSEFYARASLQINKLNQSLVNERSDINFLCETLTIV